jgi:predicted DNA-binding transcriptional regulator YafY
MNRIDRLFAILLLLQDRSRVRAQDLANHFGISQRTVYRDIAALSEMGVPVVSLPGEGYELMPGYYLPPLIFTHEEARAVFLAAQMLQQQAQGSLVQAAQQALAKIRAVLPATIRQEAEQLTTIIEFYAPARRLDLDDRRLIQLQMAIQKQQVVWLRYFSYREQAITEREVEPSQLTYGDGAWYLNGFCRLRQGWRAFRLERIERLRPLFETFGPRAAAGDVQTTVTATILFSGQIVRWVRERQHYAFISETLDGDDVQMRYEVHQLRELLPWLLGWGSRAEPLDPPELRQMIRDELTAMQKKLT